MTKQRCVLLLLCLSLLTRFVGLTSPNEVVFDEVHYGKFVDAYASSGSYFFDVHPPWGKIFPAFNLMLSGYPGGQDFDKIGNPLNRASALAIRFWPAFFGTLCPVLVFYLLITLGAQLPAAFFGASIFLLDNGLILNSRVLMLYAPLLFWQLLTLFLMFHYQKEESNKPYLIGSGLAAGLAMGTQFTGLAAPFIAFLLLLKETNRKGLRVLVKDSLLFGIPALCIYLLGFWIHFKWLPGAGPGDAFYVRSGHFWKDFLALQKVMYNASATLTTVHQDMSHWPTWFYMQKPIFYWIGNGKTIYFLGNPFVWTFGTLLLVFSLFVKVPKKHALKSEMRLFYLLFLISFIPLTLMSRVMFLYHYMIPILFGWIYLTLWLQTKGIFKSEFVELDWRGKALFGLLILGFLWIVPIVYGLKMPGFYWATIPWPVFHQ